MKRLVPRFLTILVMLTATLVQGQTGPWIITTDFGVFGRVESFSPAAPWTPSGELTVIPGDAVGRHHQGLVYVVGRGGSNLIRIHDPANGFALVREFSIGAGRNPQDIAFDGQGRAFVSCYDEAVLLLVDTDAGEVVQTFDTSSFADGDGLPETAWLRVHGDRLYVTCQKLDRNNWYAPDGPGLLLVMDLDTLQWLDPIQLTGGDPYTKIRLDGQGRFLVGCVGYWAVLDGGLEVVNPATGLSEGFLLTEAELGGDILNFDFADGDVLYALTSDAAFVTRISRVDTVSGSVTPLVTSTGYDLADLAWDGDFQLYVADRQTTAPGIRVFDSVSGSELTTGAVTTGLPPFQFILPSAGNLSPVPGQRFPVGNLQLGLPSPNPCNPAADLAIEAEPDQTVIVSVFDLRGRCVRRTSVQTDAAGHASFRFDGHAATGSALAAGLYRVVAQSPGGFAARSLTLIK